MLTIVLAFALITTSYVTAKIPSYIHVCGRRDPKIDQCIWNNIDNIKSKICEGIPDLDVPPSSPFVLDRLVISDNPNSKIAIDNSQVSGLCDFDIKFLHVNLDKLHFDVNLKFKRIQLNSTYDLDIRLLVPIVYKGPVYITTDNVEAKVNMDMSTVNKNNKRYVYMSKMKINLDIKGYTAEYGLQAAELGRLNQIIDTFLGSNQEEVIAAFKPAIEESVVKRILSLSNSIVKHFTFDELFPDRE
ncbi:PREDICTED: uncharacterized protein LOC105451799 [Wasmannia auropunctata]|uniref:uncharacterized protein LOC105451799 n=1 Tax=Wasmannia auropunctata TaxID=64793 RepID=UPI0005EE23F6|nr:PREDICTED: uncharacterized protein LOC105451799 [Wasmannia auropunctata]